MEQLGEFNYDPTPPGYNSSNLIAKEWEQLENGARYQGEWNE